MRGPFGAPPDALAAARRLVELATADAGTPPEIIAEFVLPPPDASPSRDFQTLHFDFGLPLDPRAPADVAHFTALHVPASRRAVEATTRLVPLAPLLGARAWPDRPELVRRFAAYGAGHGARQGAAGYVEGSLARIVEAAIGDTFVLPSVKAEPSFLCGMEFDTLTAEVQFFAERGLSLAGCETEVRVQPGELLIFDNLTVAHGRRGVRQPGELHQTVFGYRSAGVEHQRRVRDRVLAAFGV